MKAVHFVSTNAVLGDLHVASMLRAANSNSVLAGGILAELKKRVDNLSAEALPGQQVVVARDVRDVLHKLERAASK